MPEVQIRPAVATDLNLLIAIDHTCQSEYVWQMDINREETETVTAFREIRLPRSVAVLYPRPVATLAETWNRRAGMLTALIGESIIGYIRMNDSIIPRTTWVTDLVVTPRYRRQGVASAIILAAQTWSNNRKNTRMLMEMTTKNVPAVRLARKLGFEFCGYNDTYYATQDIAIFFGRSIA
jgi:ribosomal protein S18 acetylase RimI-like enzyme